jgi:hypothetical protein
VLDFVVVVVVVVVVAFYWYDGWLFLFIDFFP